MVRRARVKNSTHKSVHTRDVEWTDETIENRDQVLERGRQDDRLIPGIDGRDEDPGRRGMLSRVLSDGGELEHGYPDKAKRRQKQV